MLAFNLSVFFRNLRGEEVAFSARTGQTELHFVGGVVALQEHTDLTQHLAVTLGSGDLLLRIAFEEPEDEEDDPEGANVVVRLLRESGERELLLVQTTFRFGDVSLKPASDLTAHPGEEPPPDDGDQPA